MSNNNWLSSDGDGDNRVPTNTPFELIQDLADVFQDEPTQGNNHSVKGNSTRITLLGFGFSVVVAFAAISLSKKSNLYRNGSPPLSFCNHTGWQAVWTDEFEGYELDSSSWSIDVRDPGNARTRMAYATEDNVWVDNGVLVIRSNAGSWNDTTSEWTDLTSGSLHTQDKRSFAGRTRVCVRAKLPSYKGNGGTKTDRAQGFWPAHWLMPNDQSIWPTHGEIDIMEMLNGNGILHGVYHWCATNNNADDDGNTDDTVSCEENHSGGVVDMEKQGNPWWRSWMFSDEDIHDWGADWHEYAVEFGNNPYAQERQQGAPFLTFALDGLPYHTVTDPNANYFPQVPYYVILNTAIGGNWPGPPTQDTKFPTYHYVDYVRVTQPV